MSQLEFSSAMTVQLVRHMASDDFVIQAAQVSAKGQNKPDTVSERLIAALMKGRHGSPFEHTSFTFFIEVPIFVVREWQRHRMSSFNEMSGRYTELLPKFYAIDGNRKVFNIGTKMKPEMVANERLNYLVNENLTERSEQAWNSYQRLLQEGVANEVARMVLPLNIYTQMYWTVNARSLMNFLSLRIESDDSLVRSFPQREIHRAAEQIEWHFSRVMPVTHGQFILNGRVAP